MNVNRGSKTSLWDTVDTIIDEKIDEFTENYFNYESSAKYGLTVAAKQSLREYAYLLCLNVLEEIESFGESERIHDFLYETRQHMIDWDFEKIGISEIEHMMTLLMMTPLLMMK